MLLCNMFKQLTDFEELLLVGLPIKCTPQRPLLNLLLFACDVSHPFDLWTKKGVLYNDAVIFQDYISSGNSALHIPVLSAGIVH